MDSPAQRMKRLKQQNRGAKDSGGRGLFQRFVSLVLFDLQDDESAAFCTNNQIEWALAVFKRLDEDISMSLDLDEFAAAMQMNSAERLCVRLFDLIDFDHSKDVSFREFLIAVSHFGSHVQVSRENKIRCIFNGIDRNNDGFISRGEAGDFVTGRSALCSHSFRGKLWLKDILLDPRARKKSLRAVDTMQDALDRAGFVANLRMTEDAFVNAIQSEPVLVKTALSLHAKMEGFFRFDIRRSTMVNVHGDEANRYFLRDIQQKRESTVSTSQSKSRTLARCNSRELMEWAEESRRGHRGAHGLSQDRDFVSSGHKDNGGRKHRSKSTGRNKDHGMRRVDPSVEGPNSGSRVPIQIEGRNRRYTAADASLDMQFLDRPLEFNGFPGKWTDISLLEEPENRMSEFLEAEPSLGASVRNDMRTSREAAMLCMADPVRDRPQLNRINSREFMGFDKDYRRQARDEMAYRRR